jgi:hypothetical protein
LLSVSTPDQAETPPIAAVTPRPTQNQAGERPLDGAGSIGLAGGLGVSPIVDGFTGCGAESGAGSLQSRALPPSTVTT